MESRRVQRVGSSTLAVSLPSEWVKKVGLKQGDIIFFNEEEDGSLKLSVSKQASVEKYSAVEIDADLCEDPDLLCRILLGTYVLGNCVIKVSSKTRLGKEQTDAIRKLIHELIGTGIMEETHNHIIIECFIDTDRFPIHTLIRRLYIIASTMHEEAIDALAEANINLAEEAIRRKQEADTIFWIITRLLNICQRDRNTIKVMKIEDSMQILWYQLVAHFLNLIAKFSSNFALKIIELEKNRERIGTQLLNELLELSRSSYSICHNAIASFFSNDINVANEVIKNCNKIQKSEEELQKRICSHAYLHGKSFSVSKYFKGKEPLDPCMVAHISFIAWINRRIAELGSQIAEIAINKALCKDTKMCRKPQHQIDFHSTLDESLNI